MPSRVINFLDTEYKKRNKKGKKTGSKKIMSDDIFDDEFDFVDAYSEEPATDEEELLPENTAVSAINCAFLGIGGGGGKLAKAFIDVGFSRTLLVNTTEKDQPDGIDPANFVLIPGADGVGKDVDLGKKILEENGALVEDAVRARIGRPDWIFVLAGGGGGTSRASKPYY
jgi:cell division GTPase FtsZ